LLGNLRVAPRAGAWIETPLLCGRQRGHDVAPRAGAWIETLMRGCFLGISASRPARARGLKRRTACRGIRCKRVAPRAGAWIETRRAANDAHEGLVAPRAGAWIET